MRRRIRERMEIVKEVAKMAVITALLMLMFLGLMAEPVEEADFEIGMLISKGGAAVCGLAVWWLWRRWSAEKGK